MKELFLKCFEAARLIVEEEGSLYPLCNEVVAFDVGGGESDTDTRFQRTGTSKTEKEYRLPSDLATIIADNYNRWRPSSALTDAESGLLGNILGQDRATSIPGLNVLQAVRGIDPTNFTGLSALNGIIARNPYSTDYENAIGQLYDRQFAKARSLAQSGPINVRGGTARQGFELGEIDAQQAMNKFREVRGQQDKEAGVMQGAVQLLNMIESMRRGSQMQAQSQNMAGEQMKTDQSLGAAKHVNAMRGVNQANVTTAAELLGKPRQTQTDDLKGKGNQVTNTSNWGVGLTCCFIFLEALNGRLPWFVRLGRDQFNTPCRQAGYRWMSSWLVPWMRRHSLVRWLVNVLMVRPFLYQGFYFYVLKKNSIFYPVCWFWFHLWSLVGTIKREYTLWHVLLTS